MIQADFLSYDDIKAKVNSIVTKWQYLKDIPVAIEEFIENDLKLDIIPIPEFRSRYEVDGFISHDRKSITVSQELMEKYINRYRFTLAHEVGHYFLHKKLFESITFTAIENWKMFIMGINIHQYAKFESQAYDFAGILLVPDNHLYMELANAKKILSDGLENNEKDFSDIDENLLEDYICRHLANIFEVSRDVIRRRIQRENLRYLT